MKRREFIAAGAASVAAQRLLGCQSASGPDLTAAEDNAARRPNILVILADQHRADCIGVYGNPDIRTPHLDALAAEGVRYERCFCPYPVCTPSRYSLLSGRYVHDHGGSSNRCTLRSEIETYPKILRQGGYRTAAAGKMHFTPTYLDVGFDRMVLSEQDGEGRWDDDYHRELMAHDLVDFNDLEDQRREYRAQARSEYWQHCGALASNLPREFHSTEWIARQALQILDGWGPEGNLLMVGFIKPHHPFDPPEELKDLYDPAALTLLPGWTPGCAAHDLALNKGYFPHDKIDEAQLRRAMAYYYATIEHVDMQIGRMIDLLRHKGVLDNTLIVYTSDHGEYLGSHHLLLKGGYMYDPLVRVPLIIRCPGAARGGVSKNLVSLVDVPTTVLHQAGLAPDPAMQGLNLGDEDAGREMVFAESARGSQVMVRTADRKLILGDTPQVRLFFDLKDDPLEMRNHIEDTAYGEEVAVLTQALEAWRRPVPREEAFVDMNAPIIQQSNVPPRDNSHRDAIIEYYRQKMAQDQGA